MVVLCGDTEIQDLTGPRINGLSGIQGGSVMLGNVHLFSGIICEQMPRANWTQGGLPPASAALQNDIYIHIWGLEQKLVCSIPGVVNVGIHPVFCSSRC